MTSQPTLNRRSFDCKIHRPKAPTWMCRAWESRNRRSHPQPSRTRLYRSWTCRCDDPSDHTARAWPCPLRTPFQCPSKLSSGLLNCADYGVRGSECLSEQRIHLGADSVLQTCQESLVGHARRLHTLGGRRVTVFMWVTGQGRRLLVQRKGHPLNSESARWHRQGESALECLVANEVIGIELLMLQILSS